ncbi:DUF5131 family protein [Larkinella soli]|uniref:DUF5131 family protein n=1 Tax=Larkinella soli TaxID=1770527 RepID=UPI000FFC40B5|nr:DUF5131 family protein [Larkinella soli]
MGVETAISWTDATWNVARGCTKVDEDCKYCYMYRESLNNTRYNPKAVERTKTVFNLPLRLKEPQRVFTSSLTDFFHEAIDPFRYECFDIIRRCPHLTFQLLTKRPERIHDALRNAYDEAHWYNLPELGNMMFDWKNGRMPKNVWLGTSIGSQSSIQRLFDLLSLAAPRDGGVYFLSLEPMHGEIILPLDEEVDFGPKVKDLLKWVIIGGESGNENGMYRYRPCRLEWIENLVDQCQTAGIAVFVKQLGTHIAKELGLKHRHGADPSEWPEHLRVQQFPV